MLKQHQNEVNALNLINKEDIDLLDISQIRKIFKPSYCQIHIGFMETEKRDKMEKSRRGERGRNEGYRQQG